MKSKSLAAMLKRALGSMRSLLNDPPYNFMIYQLPSGYHLNIRIQPAISKIAGFERSTGSLHQLHSTGKGSEELRI